MLLKHHALALIPAHWDGESLTYNPGQQLTFSRRHLFNQARTAGLEALALPTGSFPSTGFQVHFQDRSDRAEWGP